MNFDEAYSLLLEANIFNTNELKNSIEKILKQKGVDKPEIINWFNTHFVRWMSSAEDDNIKPIQPHKFKEGEPEWAKKEGIFDFIGFNGNQVDRINHIVDYFNSLEDIDLKKIYKEPFKVINNKVDSWDIQLKKKQEEPARAQSESEVNTVYKWNDGYRFVKLITKESYKTEGNLMGHCVSSGGYFNNKDITIYSLRDSSNNPHVTLEVRNKKHVYQIKGKENRAPIQKYRPYIIEFIEKSGFVIEYDGENIGFIMYKNKCYNPESEEWKNIYIKTK